MSNTEIKSQKIAQPMPVQRKPNETGAISVQAHMRIFDPKTQKIYVEGRA